MRIILRIIVWQAKTLESQTLLLPKQTSTVFANFKSRQARAYLAILQSISSHLQQAGTQK